MDAVVIITSLFLLLDILLSDVLGSFVSVPVPLLFVLFLSFRGGKAIGGCVIFVLLEDVYCIMYGSATRLDNNCCSTGSSSESGGHSNAIFT